MYRPTLLIIALSIGLLVGCQQKEPAVQTAEQDPSVDTILNGYISAVGGRAAVELLSTRICYGRMIDDRPYKGPPDTSAFSAFSEAPDIWIMKVEGEGSSYSEGFDGEQGWNLDTAGFRITDYPRRSKLAWVFNPRGAIQLEDYFKDLEFIATTELKGRKGHHISSDREVNHYSLWFDTETHLLTGIGYHWYLEDYREVHGVMVPHRIVQGRKGGAVTLVIDSLVFNQPVDPEVFLSAVE